MTSQDSSDAIVATIVIKAPAERVFAALTDPDQRVKWWGAEGKFRATHMESDLRPGGEWRMHGVGMEGEPFLLYGEYRVVEPPNALEFTWNKDSDEPETLVRFELEDKEGSTTVRLIHSGFADAAARDRYQGWPWLLSLLQAHVETKQSTTSDKSR